MNQATTRTITLTGRAPVKIATADWPVIAEATGDSFGSHDYRHQQALSRDECDRYSLRARRHADGRVLVYGVLDAAGGGWTRSEDHRGGDLLSAPATSQQIANTLRCVGEECGLPDSLIREAIASLPAEVL